MWKRGGRGLQDFWEDANAIPEATGPLDLLWLSPTGPASEYTSLCNLLKPLYFQQFCLDLLPVLSLFLYLI